MIKLGTLSDMDKVAHLDSEMQLRIKACLAILDDCYGADRDIDRSLGGFVAVIETEADIDALKAYNLDVRNDTYEYSDVYEHFEERMYLLGSDYVVMVFFKK